VVTAGLKSATATMTVPAMNAGTRYGISARATAGFSTALTMAMRGSSTVHAPMTPIASAPPTPDSCRLARAKSSVTAVDEMTPPIIPVTPYPRRAPTTRLAR